MRAGPLRLTDLDRAYVCVVQLATQPAGVVHQVTLRPDKIAGALIRLGETQGDEILGWQYPESIRVVAVLGRGEENDKGEWFCQRETT